MNKRFRSSRKAHETLAEVITSAAAQPKCGSGFKDPESRTESWRWLQEYILKRGIRIEPERKAPPDNQA